MKKSFTLIELLVVIAVIGLLSSIIYVSLSGAREKAQRVKVVNYEAQVYRALGADMVGHWDFNEGSDDTAYDLSGYNNHGDIDGATYKCDEEDVTPYHLIGQGKDECSLEFDGDNDYVDCGEIGLDSQVTFCGWVNTNSWAAHAAVFSNFNHGNNKGLNIIPYSASQIRVYFGDGVSAYSGASRFNFSFSQELNKWYYYCIIYDGSEVIVYVDGAEIDRREKTVDLSSLNFLIGRWASSYSYYNYEGKIDNVRIYNRSLESAEIKGLYYAGLNNLLAKEQIDYNEYKELIK